MSNPKIFIVEDQELISEHIKRNLRKQSFVVSGTAKSADETFSKIEINKPNLILMDINLKGDMDGIDAAQYIKDKWDIPFIYLTAANDERTLDRAKKTEPYGFANKNISDKDLKREIDFALYSHQKELERVEIRNELDNNRKLFNSIVELSRDATFVIEKDQTVSVWNNAAVHTFGFSKQEVMGQNFFDLNLLGAFNQIVKDVTTDIISANSSSLFGNAFTIEAKKKDGTTFPAEMELRLDLMDGQWKICGYVKDITDEIEHKNELLRLITETNLAKDLAEQRAEELSLLNHKLTESEIELTKLNSDKDRFFSIIAHDLKGPFQALLGYSELLSSNSEDLSKEEIEEFATSLNESAQNLFKLLENLLNWARLQRGAVDFAPEKVSSKLLLEDNINLVAPRAKQKGVETKIGFGEDFEVFCDKNMIDTVIRNLLANSVKFTNSGDTLGVKAKKVDANFAEFCVFDTGLGIPEHVIVKLFQIGEKVTTKGTANETGTGLGLILCQELVEKNGGKIWVESTLGKGSEFKFTVPLVNS